MYIFMMQQIYSEEDRSKMPPELSNALSHEREVAEDPEIRQQSLEAIYMISMQVLPFFFGSPPFYILVNYLFSLCASICLVIEKSLNFLQNYLQEAGRKALWAVNGPRILQVGYEDEEDPKVMEAYEQIGSLVPIFFSLSLLLFFSEIGFLVFPFCQTCEFSGSFLRVPAIPPIMYTSGDKKHSCSPTT